MSTTIGKKIRELRKELKMTQSELAGNELTKSMLSHIETGHSNPSMKSLEYIAMKLNKPVAYFLEDDTKSISKQREEKQLPMDKILYVFKNIDELIKKKSYELAKTETEKLLSLYTFNEENKLYADIVYRLGYCNLKLNRTEEGKKLIDTCSDIYMDNFLYEEATRSYMDLLKLELENYNYNACMNMLDKIHEIYSKSTNKNIFLEIEILVIQPSVYFALGDFEKTIHVCEKAISLSTENNIYYRLDDAYRILAITYMLQGDFNRFDINANEAKKYVEFTGNKLNLSKIYHNYAKYENKRNNPLEAMKYLHLLESTISEKTFYYYLEYGKTQYLIGNYTKAIEALMKINSKEKPAYLMDCIYIATSKIYKGLIYCKLGNFQESVIEIEEGIKDIEFYSNLEYKGFVMCALNELSFAYNSLSEVYSLNGYYENAYILLKKSNEVNTLYKNNLSNCKTVNLKN